MHNYFLRLSVLLCTFFSLSFAQDVLLSVDGSSLIIMVDRTKSRTQNHVALGIAIYKCIIFNASSCLNTRHFNYRKSYRDINWNAWSINNRSFDYISIDRPDPYRWNFNLRNQKLGKPNAFLFSFFCCAGLKGLVGKAGPDNEGIGSDPVTCSINCCFSFS